MNQVSGLFIKVVIVAFIFVAGEAFGAKPTREQQIQEHEYRVIGFTTTTVRGYSKEFDPETGMEVFGWLWHSVLCKDEVAPNAKPATIDEFIRSTDLEVPRGSFAAWVSPSKIDILKTDTNQFVAYTTGMWNELLFGSEQPTYRDALDGLSCGAWRSASSNHYGTVVTTPITGYKYVHIRSCSTYMPVACSAPIAVTH